MTYTLNVLRAALTALTRINVKDGRIEEIRRAIEILEKHR